MIPKAYTQTFDISSCILIFIASHEMSRLKFSDVRWCVQCKLFWGGRRGYCKGWKRLYLCDDSVHSLFYPAGLPSKSREPAVFIETRPALFFLSRFLSDRRIDGKGTLHQIWIPVGSPYWWNGFSKPKRSPYWWKGNEAYPAEPEIITPTTGTKSRSSFGPQARNHNRAAGS